MKTVVSFNDVAHFWANKTQDNARVSAGNFYFQDDAIYSYGSHFPIAVHYKGVVLFTLGTYSNTTSGHVSTVARAASHFKKIYCLQPIAAAEGRHEKNIQYWLAEIEGTKAKLIKARKPEVHISHIERTIEALNLYIQFFDIKLTAEQKKALIIKDKEGYLKDITERAAKQAKKDAAKLKAGKPIYEAGRKAWQEYNLLEFNRTTTPEQRNVANFYFQSIGGYDTETILLRTNGSEVETSKNVKMSTDIAKRYYAFYTRIVKAGGCTGNCNYQMMNYDVKEATAKALIVGCHNIPVSEINAIAAKLNWL